MKNFSKIILSCFIILCGYNSGHCMNKPNCDWEQIIKSGEPSSVEKAIHVDKKSVTEENPEGFPAIYFLIKKMLSDVYNLKPNLSSLRSTMKNANMLSELYHSPKWTFYNIDSKGRSFLNYIEIVTAPFKKLKNTPGDFILLENSLIDDFSFELDDMFKKGDVKGVEAVCEKLGEETFCKALMGKINAFYPTPIHLLLHNHPKTSKNQLFIINLVYGKIKNPEIFLQKDAYGDTPLHYACAYGLPEVVSLIVKTCPKALSEKNNAGETALEITKKFMHKFDTEENYKKIISILKPIF